MFYAYAQYKRTHIHNVIRTYAFVCVSARCGKPGGEPVSGLSFWEPRGSQRHQAGRPSAASQKSTSL